MEKNSPYTNKNINYYCTNRKNINFQNIYSNMNSNANMKNYNNNNNKVMHFNKDSKIKKQDMGINKTPLTKGQYTNRDGYHFYNYSNMYYINSPAAPLFNQSKFPGLNKIQPFNLNNYNGNLQPNQPINTNSNIKLNNNINTNKSKDNLINNYIKNNNNNNNIRNQNNLTEEDYTIEVLKSKHIFRTKTPKYNRVPINQKLQTLKNKDNNIDEENNNFCKGSTNNNIRNTAYFIKEAFTTNK